MNMQLDRFSAIWSPVRDPYCVIGGVGVVNKVLEPQIFVSPLFKLRNAALAAADYVGQFFLSKPFRYPQRYENADAFLVFDVFYRIDDVLRSLEIFDHFGRFAI